MDSFSIFRLLPSEVPTLFAQNEFSAPLFKNTSIDPTLLLSILGSLVALILLIVYGVYRYNKWKQYVAFEDEMKSLGMDSNAEDTLAGMVKRFQMDEPVQILFSPRLFDEMATNEILRVLASSGSLKAKQNFIDTIYEIRNKTYSPDLVASNEDEESEMAVAQGSDNYFN